MESVRVGDEDIPIDKEGYLEYYRDWNEEVAQVLADQDGLDLSENHWEVIHFLRKYYDDYQIAPNVRTLAKAMGKKLGSEKGNSKYLHGLFSYDNDDGRNPARDPAQEACRLAGLPNPPGSV